MQNIYTGLKKRLIIWALSVACLLTIPLILTLLGSGVDGDGWHWTFFDFVFMGILLFGAGLGYELISRKFEDGMYKIAVGIAVLTGFLLVWINAAVGIIGDGDNGIGMMYFGVLLVGLIGAVLSRFRPTGLAQTLFIMAVGIMLIPTIVFTLLDPQIMMQEPGVMKVFILNGFFAVMFIGSGLMFRKAALK